MSELKKPTIKGLIEKLLEENHIQENEVGTVQALLGQASNGLNKDEIFTLVSKLNDKLDAHTSDLITPNGLNYSVFESEVKTVAQVINKEKVQREKSQKQATVEPLQEKKDIEKTPQEKAEIERQQRIAENKDYLKGLLKRIPGADKLGITEEDLEEIAETKEVNDRFWDATKVCMEKEKCSAEEATEKIAKEYGFEAGYFESNAYKAAEATHCISIFEECFEKNQNGERILEKLEENPARLEIAKKIIPGLAEALTIVASSPKKAFEVLTGSLVTILSEMNQEKQESIEKNIEANEAKILEAMQNKEGTSAKTIQDYIYSISAWKEELSKRKNWSDGARNQDAQKKYDKFFERITPIYLSSNSNGSISNLYERLKDNSTVKELELEFEDFVIGIEKNLRKDQDKFLMSYIEIDYLIEQERKVRRFDLFNKTIEEAKRNGNKITDEYVLRDSKKEEERVRRECEKYKKIFANRRKITQKDDSITEKRNKIGSRKSSPEKLENDIVRISNDRKEIIRISKEFGISTDEAAQKYFSENENALKLYTKRERKILAKEEGDKKRIVKPQVLKKLRIFRKEKNEQLIEKYTSEIEYLTKQIEIGDESSIALDAKIQLLNRANEKLLKAQRRKIKLEKQMSSKTATGILDNKEQKEVEKKIFESYLKEGKTAVEFLKQLNENESGKRLNIEEILKIIENGARKYLTAEVLHNFIVNERTALKNTALIEALKIKKDNAEKQGLTDLALMYGEKLTTIEESQALCESSIAEKRNLLLVRMGLKANEIGRTEGATQTQETAQIPDSGESKTSSAIDLNQTQEEQERGNKNSLAVEELEVTGAEIGVESLKKIAKKNKVTPKRIKEAFSKIAGLRKSKQEVVEQTEQDVNPDEKTTQTNTEGIR